MFKASELIKTSRLERQYSLKDITLKTKIPIKYLRAIEEGNENDCPNEPYCSLFVGKYADFLGLEQDKIVSLFRRDIYQKTKDNQESLKHSVYLTPQFLFTATTILTLSLMFIFLLGRYMSFNKPPKLEVDWPKLTTDTTQLRISGVTDVNCTVRINDDLVIVDSNGNFSKMIDVDSDRKIIIESASPSGKKTVVKKDFDN